MNETVKLKHEDFLKHGFEKIGCHLVKYSKQLVSENVINEQGLEDDEIPSLFFGRHPTKSSYQFAIFTGHCYVWLIAGSIEEAVEISNSISGFDYD